MQISCCLLIRKTAYWKNNIDGKINVQWVELKAERLEGGQKSRPG